MSFSKRLLTLLNAEIDNKRNMKALRLLKQAKLKEKADVNHIHYSAERVLDREMMEELCDLSWMAATVIYV
ncbi:ATP-binding protein [Neisseria leonii]